MKARIVHVELDDATPEEIDAAVVKVLAQLGHPAPNASRREYIEAEEPVQPRPPPRRPPAYCNQCGADRPRGPGRFRCPKCGAEKCWTRAARLEESLCRDPT